MPSPKSKPALSEISQRDREAITDIVLEEAGDIPPERFDRLLRRLFNSIEIILHSHENEYVSGTPRKNPNLPVCAFTYTQTGNSCDQRGVDTVGGACYCKKHAELVISTRRRGSVG